ncbi:MAG: molybdopterin molybdotransferase MoeA [Syntrophobacteraceae bacterium]|nr:molybdopterin molybdotransferase MoeA [Syntrophobacteraceae bacterium]
MSELERIQALILESTPVLGREMVHILGSLGRVLSGDIAATEDVPSIDISAVDGFAVSHLSLDGASKENPVVFTIIGESPAGRPCGAAVGYGEAVRIMTGGVIPEGADGVVKKEDTEDRGTTVVCWSNPGRGGNIRLRGEAFTRGDLVLSAGDIVGPVEVCELASLRRAYVHVYQKPVVAIMSTGDELSDFHESSSPGKTMCSTLYGLAAQVLEAGAVPLLLGIAPDSSSEQREMLSEGLRADVVITSGGLSRGKYDFVRETFDSMGVDIKFRNIALKPGKPAVFGAINGTLVFGFPGNPSATMISFEQFVKPALLKMMGRRAAGVAPESPFSAMDSFRLDVVGGNSHLRASLVPCRKPGAGDGKH